MFLKQDESPAVTATERAATQPEDGYLVVGDDPPIFLAAARQAIKDGHWTIDSGISIPGDWNGAAFVAARDQAVIGMYRITDTDRWIAPLDRLVHHLPGPRKQNRKLCGGGTTGSCFLINCCRESIQA